MNFLRCRYTAGANGGALTYYNQRNESDSLNIINTVFENNYARNGGGFFVNGYQGNGGLNNCTFIDNDGTKIL